MKLFCKIILFLMGWRVEKKFPHHIKKAIVIAGPHTSAWDFVVVIAFRSALGMNNAKFLGKEELFNGPFGFLFRWLGGTPVNRYSKTGLVDQVVEKFNSTDELLIGLSPEGTRKKVDKLKSGFYYMAQKATVPIIMMGLDYEHKRLTISDPFYTSGSQEDDFKKIIQYFGKIKGKRPELGLQDLMQKTI